MKKLILTAALLVLPGLALAENPAFTRTDCELTKAENGNWLTYVGTCAGGEVITGGYTVASTTTERGVTTTTYNGRPSEGPRQTVEIAAN
jgi:hypothetical protein